jgi:hypothetical protein
VTLGQSRPDGGNPDVCRFSALIAITAALATAPIGPALAWGDEGHRIVALIAQSLLDPAVGTEVAIQLASDPSPLTAHDMASEATWADRLRDANPRGARDQTSRWHFVDIETTAPDVDQACFNHPVLPTGIWASKGPARDCIIDKIMQFEAELAQPAVPSPEQLVALKFLLHFIGDLHQPLHAADDSDRGGNTKRVSAAGFKPGTLHHFWDTSFVNRLGPDPQKVAAELAEHITGDQIAIWSQGTPTDWAMETFTIAHDDAYGHLPAQTRRGTYRLDAAYVTMATQDVAVQLSRAGVRLAVVLNRALARPGQIRE